MHSYRRRTKGHDLSQIHKHPNTSTKDMPIIVTHLTSYKVGYCVMIGGAEIVCMCVGGVKRERVTSDIMTCLWTSEYYNL